jgi:serine/threonine protein phosphatase 1
VTTDKGVWVIADIHGCLETLKALIAKLPEDAEIVFCGDLIDRGLQNRDVIQFIIDKGYKCVLGNHDHLLDNDISDEYWKQHYTGWVSIEYKDNDEVYKEHVKWIKSLPIYIEYPELRDENDRYLVVSHTSIAPFWNHRSGLKENLSQNDDCIWETCQIPKDIKDVFNVMGHMVVNKPLVREHFAKIDTGGVFNKGYNKHLTALHFPSKMIIQQENIENE